MTNYTDKKDKETRENNEISDFLKCFLHFLPSITRGMNYDLNGQ